MVGRLRHLDDTADVSNGLALGEQLLSGLELTDDLLGGVADSFHGGVPGPAWPDEDSHSHWTNSQGPRQRELRREWSPKVSDCQNLSELKKPPWQPARLEVKSERREMRREDVIRFDLSWLDPGERFQFWHDHGSLIHRPVVAKEVDYRNLHVKLDGIQLGSISTCRMSASAQQYQRTDRMIKLDQVDHLTMVVVKAGTIKLGSKSIQSQASTGDIFFLDAAIPCESLWSSHQIYMVNIPRSLTNLPRRLENDGFIILRQGEMATKLLHLHVQTLWDFASVESLTPDGALGMALVAQAEAYLQSRYERKIRMNEDDPHPLLLKSIRRWIDGNIFNKNLGAENIIANFHVSRSTLYRLFAPWGGVRRYILERRLEIARHLLRSEEYRDASITSLASKTGFSSVAVFSRSFSDRWGVSPREFRANLCKDKTATYASDSVATAGPHSKQGVRSELEAVTQKYYGQLDLKRG